LASRAGDLQKRQLLSKVNSALELQESLRQMLNQPGANFASMKRANSRLIEKLLEIRNALEGVTVG
jgi:hypothetical protein